MNEAPPCSIRLQGGVLMNQTFDVYLGNQVTGKAEVEKQGLYYRISSRCQLTGAVIYRLVVSCGDKETKLGIFVPDDEAFSMVTTIPVKHIGTGEMHFKIVPKHQPVKEHFIPLTADQPFAYISQLENAHLQRQGDTGGIVLNDEAETTHLEE